MKGIDNLREYVLTAPSICSTTRAILVCYIDGIEREVADMRDFCERLDDAATKREDVTLWGVDYTPLPLDADGVPIHVGDVIAYEDNTKPKEVVALVPPSVVIVEDGPRFADMCRHHHAPTVEDVLAEFANRVCNSGHQWGLDAADTIAEYAAKLRLAGDE